MSYTIKFSTFLASVISAVMFWLALPGYGHWAFAYFCLVPIALNAFLQKNIAHFALSACLFSFMLYFVAYCWLLKLESDKNLLYILIIGSAIHSIYLIIGFLVIHRIFNNFDLPATIVLPLVMVSVEYLPELLPSLSPGIQLGLSAYKNIYVVQISDITGIYGITFFLAMINGAIVDFLIIFKKNLLQLIKKSGFYNNILNSMDKTLCNLNSSGLYPRTKVRVYAILFCGMTILTALLYGKVRLNQVNKNITSGPVISIAKVPCGANQAISYVLKSLKSNADIILLPEGISGTPLNKEFMDIDGVKPNLACIRNKIYKEASEKYNKVIVLGGDSIVDNKRFNSAYVYLPDKKNMVRYDKMELVPFAEFIPFKKYGGYLLNRYFGWNQSFFYTSGDQMKTFHTSLSAYGDFSFSTPICFEIMYPSFIRKMSYNRQHEIKNDAILNLTNDGGIKAPAMWYKYLAFNVFRAVENRIPIARSNTEILALVSPDGNIKHQIKSDTDDEKIVASLPILPSTSVYSRIGDVFSSVCFILLLLIFLQSIFR